LTWAGCTFDGGGLPPVEEDSGGGEDTEPPVIDFVPPTDSFPWGQDIILEAGFSDNETLFVYDLHYKKSTEADKDYRAISFAPAEAEGRYTAKIRAAEQNKTNGMEYYLEARDVAGNITYSPERGMSEAYHIRLVEE
jgi:hypothetical protein